MHKKGRKNWWRPRASRIGGISGTILCYMYYNMLTLHFVWISFVAYALSAVSKFVPVHGFCGPAIKMNDLIYVFCSGYGKSNLRAYEVSIPHDLLMITHIEEFIVSEEMVGIEKTSTVYISHLIRWSGCIWKIDTLNNKVEEWLSNVGFWFHLSIASDDQILILRVFVDPLFMIYDQNAKLVRSFSLPYDCIECHPFIAIQKPNGEFIVSHGKEKDNGTFISFLSMDGQTINQFSVKEDVDFKDLRLFIDKEDNNLFAFEEVFGNLYLINPKTLIWIEIGRLQGVRLYYDSEKKHFIETVSDSVHIWKFNKN